MPFGPPVVSAITKLIDAIVCGVSGYCVIFSNECSAGSLLDSRQRRCRDAGQISDMIT